VWTSESLSAAGASALDAKGFRAVAVAKAAADIVTPKCAK